MSENPASVPVPLLDLKAQYATIRHEIRPVLDEVCDAQGFILGPRVEAFEKAVAAYVGTKHAIGMSSGTDSQLAAMMAAGVGPGDDVVTSPYSFFSTAGAVARLGAKAVFCDIEPETFNLDPSRLAAAITPRTKLIQPVHLYGQCADMPAIKKIADKHKLLVIEDNAQAIDAAGDTFKIGELSDAVATSFIIQKNLGCFGDGGAIVTNNEQVNKVTRLLRSHGSPARNVHSFGFNSRLDDLQAGVLSAKLKHIHEWNDNRIKWAARYTAGLKSPKSFTLPYAKPGYRHVWHLYVIEVKDAAKRDAFVDFLVKNGVDAKTHYSIAIHKQAGYPWGKGARVVGSLENAERNAATCISLPMFPELTAEEVDYVVAQCLAWDKANS